jgi:hypothetical protein
MLHNFSKNNMIEKLEELILAFLKGKEKIDS